MVKVYLIGFTSSGKSTLGHQLAFRFGSTFVDIDEYIREKEGRSVQEIFRKEGEVRMREIEMMALQNISRMENAIVSTGGGTPCFYDNMQLMNSTGITVYLKASPEFLIDRLKGSMGERPLINFSDISELTNFVNRMLEKRESYYKLSQITINAETDNGEHIYKDIKAHLKNTDSTEFS